MSKEKPLDHVVQINSMRNGATGGWTFVFATQPPQFEGFVEIKREWNSSVFPTTDELNKLVDPWNYTDPSGLEYRLEKATDGFWLVYSPMNDEYGRYEKEMHSLSDCDTEEQAVQAYEIHVANLLEN